MDCLMSRKKSGESVLPLINSSVSTLFSHPIIFAPYIIIVFLQLLILEVLYFYPRYPLNAFFGPLVRKFWGESFLHYPKNFTLIPKLFQTIQIPMYIFLSVFLIAVSIALLKKINYGKRLRFGKVLKDVLGTYVHLVIAALLMFFMIWVFLKAYGLIYQRALQIRSQSGWFYYLKITVIQGAPYFNLIWAVFINAIFAYLLPSIVVGKKKIFSAIAQNFKMLYKAFWLTFLTVLIPSLLFIPVLWLRQLVTIERFFPELTIIILVLGVFISACVDAMIYTALSLRFLVKVEEE